MSNPLAVLKEALKSVFDLEPIRNGKYSYDEIQHLKVALDNFKLNNKDNFIELSNAIGAALPRLTLYMQKGHLNFNLLKTTLDAEAKSFKLPSPNWKTRSPKSSLRFQFGEQRNEQELLPWLKTISGINTLDNNSEMLLNLLIKHHEHYGFSQKLGTHLQKDPDFLFRLIMKSAENFSLIASTRLVLYLTDKQLAEAIIQHIPQIVQSHKNPVTQAEKLVDALNNMLSNGRSVSTLLRSEQAKQVLDNSKLLQIYQGEETNQIESTNPPSSFEGGGFKPGY